MFLNGKKSFWDSKKKNSEVSARWAVVILKPLHDQIRHGLVESLCRHFDMAVEEAENVVLNTPNILFDELTQEAAGRVKDLFRETGAEMFITDDAVVKSKCYRTVWPETPDLAWLEAEPSNGKAESKKEPFEMPAEEFFPAADAALKQGTEDALPELEEESELPAESSLFGSSNEEEEEEEEEAPAAELPQPESVTDSSFIFSRKESGELKKEFDEWKERYEAWKKSFEGMSRDLERLREDRRELHESVEETRTVIQDRETQIEAQKNLMQGVEAHYRKLQEEFSQNRTDFEQRMARLDQEVAAWKTQASDLMTRLVSVEKEKGSLQHSFQNQRQQYEGLEREYYAARADFERKVTESAQEVQRWREQAEHTAGRMNEMEASRQQLEKTLQEQQIRYAKLEKEYRESRRLAKMKAGLTAEEFAVWEEREKRMTEKLELLEKMQNQVVQDLERRRARDEEWQKQARKLDQGLKALAKTQEKIEALFGKPKKTTRKKA